MFKKQYIIVDDFYDNPEAITSLVNDLPTEEVAGGNYAGVMSELQLYTDTHAEIFKSMSGGNTVEPVTQLNGKFRYTNINDVPKQKIHFDPGQNQVWSGVCYLGKEPEGATDEELNSYGTDFWKHNRTGLTDIPMTREGIEEHGWKGVDDLKVFLETDGMDESLWTKTFTVPYKYNRLVLFRPWMFHSPGKAFGTDKSNCRMIQTFFLGIPN